MVAVELERQDLRQPEYSTWQSSRFVVVVLNNRDLNMVSWELRALGGSPKVSETQDVPDFDYAGYARLLGLTDKGHLIYQASQRLFAAIEEFRAEAGAARGALVGNLMVGIVDNLINNPACRLHETIARFNQRAPEVQISVQVAAPTELERAVLEGRFDLGFGACGRHSPYLHYEDVLEEHVLERAEARRPELQAVRDDRSLHVAVLHDDVFDAARDAALDADGVVLGDDPAVFDAHAMAVDDVDPVAIPRERRVDVEVPNEEVVRLEVHDAQLIRERKGSEKRRTETTRLYGPVHFGWASANLSRGNRRFCSRDPDCRHADAYLTRF